MREVTIRLMHMALATPDKATLDALRIDRTKPARTGTWLALLAVAVALITVFVTVLVQTRRPGPLAVRTVRVHAPQSNASSTLLNASGYVTARRAATVSSKATGKVIDVLVEEGMQVEDGQVLARLDASNIEMNLELAKAQLESAHKALGETRANLEHAEREFRRIERLTTEHAASQVELDRAATDVRVLEARLARHMADIAVSEREVALWHQQLEDSVIRAPFPGIVTSKNAQPGEMISPVSAGGGFTRTGICTIVDMNSLEIEVDVSESYINRVGSGQPVEAVLDAYPQWRIPARVIAIIPTADRQKATVKVRVGFEETDPRILPDMSVKAAFQSPEDANREPSSPTIPRAAIRQREGRDFVWIVRGGRLERRIVTIGERGREEVAIVAGLVDGERLVVEGPENLVEGAEVRETGQ